MRNSTKRIFTRSLSGFLALLTFVGLFASLSLLPVFAADDTSGSEPKSFADKWNQYYTHPDEGADFSTEEKRVEAMGEAYYSNENFELYVDQITGEVALKDKTTGDLLFTNPYDVVEHPISSATANGKKVIAQTYKQRLLSQVHIYYVENGTTKEYNSFKDAALLGQIKVKRLNGGVRVEYSIGEEESRTLVPRLISTVRFEEMILAQLRNNLPKNPDGSIASSVYERLQAWYMEKDPDDPTITPELREEMYSQFPITKEFAVMVFSETALKREVKLVESWIKQYCPKYTFEELDKDHRETKYTEKNIAPANFKMALEYYLTANGVEVRFPANGLTFDESNYELTSIEILQYMGAGLTYYNGYTFVPDGSGSITRFEDTTSYTSQGGKVYGQDYSYQEIGSQNQQVFRLPVFGVVTDDNVQTGYDSSVLEDPKDRATGYVAVVTEGDALTTITSVNGGKVYCYGSVYCSFNPRPKDTYNLAEAISVGGSAEYTVVSKRKYTGSFRINYIMLTDSEYTADDANAEAIAAATATGRKFYDTSYMGMAKAYRDYLENKGDIKKIETAKADIPLYVEVFGLTETDESILSIPVIVKKALTSFDDLKTIVEELGAAKSPITNLNFKLRGFTNGGMVQTVPTKVKFEKVVGGNSGFRDFLDYAVEKNIGVYPEFDFAYMEDSALFDGFSYRRDAVKTIDNRYITKRVYDAVLQSFSRTEKICISASVYRDFFSKFNKSMTKVLDGRTTGISVGTLGSDLNSDFDEDEPYNREDSKGFTAEMLGQIKDNFGGKVMIDAGNAFAVPYASVVLNAPLDSSRFLSASQSVPFFGLVFHGYVELAGTPTNMAGDIKYETLKILENGATLYMMFSYQNVELLKEDPTLSQYYAISYEIWKDTLLSQYGEDGALVSEGLYDRINNALKDVQTSRINDHQFVNCVRQLTQQELADITLDAQAEYNASYAALKEKLDHHMARLNDYNRIVTQYGGADTEDAKQFLALYGLNKTDIDRQISIYETQLSILERDGVQAIIDKMSGQIDLDITDGSVVYVEYENGHWFLLNYNNYTVEVEWEGQTIVIEPKNFFDSNANA